MKRKAFTLFAVVATILAFALPMQAQEPPTEAMPTLEAEVAHLAPSTDSDQVTTTAVVPIPVFEAGASWHCPYNAPHCFTHDNCDAYCGDPRFGYCLSNGCCACSG